MNQKHVEMISRTLGSGLSCRGVLRALGAGGAGGMLAVLGHEAIASERPHQRLHKRTPQRNRKQRTNRRRNNNQTNNKNNNNNNQGNQTGQLGSLFGLGTSVSFMNYSSVTYRVTVGNSSYDIPHAGEHWQLAVTDDGYVRRVL